MPLLPYPYCSSKKKRYKRKEPTFLLRCSLLHVLTRNLIFVRIFSSIAWHKLFSNYIADCGFVVRHLLKRIGIELLLFTFINLVVGTIGGQGGK